MQHLIPLPIEEGVRMALHLQHVTKPLKCWQEERLGADVSELIQHNALTVAANKWIPYLCKNTTPTQSQKDFVERAVRARILSC